MSQHKNTKTNSNLAAPHRQEVSTSSTTAVNDEYLAAKADPAGKHLIIDFWGAKHLEDLKIIETSLCEAAKQSGATLLHTHLHKFGEGGGVTGVALLAESHISIHTWPELSYAALDVFMCGRCDPELAVAHLSKMFKPKTVEVREILRGENKR